MAALRREVLTRLRRARVARLATADARGRPHVVPICFAAEAGAVYHAIDAKPKGRPAEGLRRVRNIVANPHVALLVDHYEEDWRRLWFVLVRGRARLLRRGAARARGLHLLRQKYAQYRRGMLPEDALVIAIRPHTVVTWGARQ
jgi:PPOX class probable F420-dependent enzyme